MDINLGLTADATGTVDVITATYSPAPTLVDKKILFLVASGANTSTTPTFSPNGLTARTIVKNGGQALLAGDIPSAGFVAILEYNLANTRWELLNPSANTLISQTITNGVTNKAPSEDAVFDALALKATRWNKMVSFASTATIADSTAYLVCDIPDTTLATIARAFRFGIAGTVREFTYTQTQTTNGSSENVTLYLRNVTTATDFLIGTYTSDYGASAVKTFLYTGLSIAVNTTDDWCLKILTPVFGTNPGTWRGSGEFYVL